MHVPAPSAQVSAKTFFCQDPGLSLLATHALLLTVLSITVRDAVGAAVCVAVLFTLLLLLLCNLDAAQKLLHLVWLVLYLMPRCHPSAVFLWRQRRRWWSLFSLASLLLWICFTP